MIKQRILTKQKKKKKGSSGENEREKKKTIVTCKYALFTV